MHNKRIGLKFMNLQLLAADTGATGGTDTGTDAGADVSTQTDAGTETQSFDDILNNADYKAEFDRRVQQAINAEQTKWQANQQQQIDDAVSEADKLRNMTDREKTKYQDQKRKEALDKREKDITTRELKAQARETLAEKNLPRELIDTLNFESAEACNKSIESVEKAFQNAVQKAVDERLKGNKPTKPTTPSDGTVFGFNFVGVRPKNNI